MRPYLSGMDLTGDCSSQIAVHNPTLIVHLGQENQIQMNGELCLFLPLCGILELFFTRTIRRLMAQIIGGTNYGTDKKHLNRDTDRLGIYTYA